MNVNYVADTMSLVLRLEERVFPSSVKNIFIKAESGDITLGISPMVLAEIGYLSEKKRIDIDLLAVFDYIKKHHSIIIIPITGEIIKDTFQIDDITELHDRIIAATALHLKACLLTNDPVICNSVHIQTMWNKEGSGVE